MATTRSQVEDAAWAALKYVYDPELGMDVVSLGLIYHLTADDEGNVLVQMTLTTPGCPLTEVLPDGVREAVEQVPGVKSVNVELVWDPPWTPDRIKGELHW